MFTQVLILGLVAMSCVGILAWLVAAGADDPSEDR